MLTMTRIDELTDRAGTELGVTFTFESASGGKPVCVANAIYRVYEER